MSLISSNAYILIFLSFSLVLVSKSEDTTSCGDDWKLVNVPNVNKCIRLMGKELREFVHAQEICEVETGQDMVSIHSEEEQDFIAKYLFVEKNVSDSAWIGLKRDKGSWAFTDTSPINKLKEFWSIGNPSNDSGSDCVEMSSKKSQLGKWDDEVCNKRNLVICQKDPTLKNNFLRDTLNNITKIISDCFNGQLKDIGLESFGNFGDIYKGKFGYFGYFKDYDGKQKIFLFPNRENKKLSTFQEAEKICNRFNSSLVEVPTWEKQMILNLFLSQIFVSLNSEVDYFWLNAENSDGEFKWKRSKASLQRSYTNWYKDSKTTFPISGGAYLTTFILRNENFGKWMNRKEDEASKVICEYSIN